MRGILKIGSVLGLYPFARAPILYTGNPGLIRFPGYPWLIREICTARDRLLTYRQVRRAAINRQIVICDRFPLRQIRYMDGPQAEWMTANQPKTRLLQLLAAMERRYYEPILPPDILFVLKVDPVIAAQRKVEESAESVRARNAEIWQTDWGQTNAIVIDASKPKEQVLADIKAQVWSRL